MEDNIPKSKSQPFPQEKKSSLNIKSKKSEQNTSSNITKKNKKEEIEDEEDLTNKILSNLTYENFESEQEKFFPHYRKKHEEITINNVPLLDQNRFRFLISNNSSIFEEYTKYEKGNFKNIKWEDIKLVYYYYVEDYQCPICLENKLCCPIIINCGHIFCYPCFLNFYNYYTTIPENKKLPKCPLCSEFIDLEKNSIKFCEMIQCKNYTNNMKIKFNLIMREKTSPTLFNLIYDPSLIKWKQSLKNQMNSIPFEISKEFIFSRFFSTNKTLTRERINNLIKETKEALKEEKEFYADEGKIKSLEQCIEILENTLKNNDEEKDFIIENVFQKEKNNNKNKFDDNNNINIINNNTENNNNINNVNIQKEEEINYKKYYLFYQEEEGDIYYLDPFIMDILLTEYGDYSNLPVEISGNILDVNMKQITSSIKSNYPYLSHLYLGSIIFFVEIDINKLISPFTRKKFSHALNERAKRRRLLSNEEKNYEKFINKKSIKEKEEMQNYFKYHNKNNIIFDKKGGEVGNNIQFNFKEEMEEAKEKNEINEDKKEDNKENDNNKEIKKESMLKKLLEESVKEEKEREEKERLEKERLEKEKKEKEKNKIFVFDEKDFPELKSSKKEDKKEKDKEKEEEKEKENNKGGKKGKKKGKKKFRDVEEDFLIDAFKPEENPKPKWKKSSKHN